MAYGFTILGEGDDACFTRPELKVERVSYDVPTPGALEGMLKSIYWKPSMKYVIDRIVIMKPINFVNIRRNEVKDKILISAVKKQVRDSKSDISIYTADARTQRAAMVLKDVKYGISFHFELTNKKNERENVNPEEKHFSIIKRRLEKGQHFRTPCLGCSEFPVRKIELVEQIDESEISENIIEMGDVDLGFMSYRVNFEDEGNPINKDWDNPIFSDKATTLYYRPHMINGIIDVGKYREGMVC